MLSWMTRDQVIGIASDIEREAETAAATARRASSHFAHLCEAAERIFVCMKIEMANAWR